MISSVTLPLTKSRLREKSVPTTSKSATFSANTAASGVAREILEALLDRYMNTGIYEIEQTEILQLDPFRKYGKPSKIASYFGGREGYRQALKELEAELYKAG